MAPASDHMFLGQASQPLPLASAQYEPAAPAVTHTSGGACWVVGTSPAPHLHSYRLAVLLTAFTQVPVPHSCPLFKSATFTRVAVPSGLVSGAVPTLT